MKELERPNRKGYRLWDLGDKNAYITDLQNYCNQLESERDELKEKNKEWEIDNEIWMKTSLADITKDNAKLRQELQTLKGLNDSWPLKDILKKLIEGADILLNKKDYDGHGWEEISLARKMAKDKLKELLTPKE